MATEFWRKIPGFPNYSISNIGRVRDDYQNRLVAVSRQQDGHLKISMWSEDGCRYTRSVALMVAEAFVECPDELSDHVILLDGKFNNVAATNMAWRPRWFAWKYTRQLQGRIVIPYQNLAVYNCTNRRRYPSIVACGKREGLLFEDIWSSVNTGRSVYPQHYVFRITQRV